MGDDRRKGVEERRTSTVAWGIYKMAEWDDSKSDIIPIVPDNGGRRRDLETREWFALQVNATPPDGHNGCSCSEALVEKMKEGMHVALRRFK